MIVLPKSESSYILTVMFHCRNELYTLIRLLVVAILLQVISIYCVRGGTLVSVNNNDDAPEIEEQLYINSNVQLSEGTFHIDA